MAGVRWLFVVVALAYGSVAVSPASAETVVSGDLDSNAPLVIDPTAAPVDPLTRSTASNTELVMFVRMPVTKVVDEVALGDFAVPSSCANATASLKIEEYENGVLGGPGSQFYSQSPVTIGTTGARLTWEFSPVTMREGRGYGFRVSVSGCSSFEQTTWQHNEAQIDPGPARCTSGPHTWRRMWHEAGVDDAVPGCVDRPPGSRKFDLSMPTGWLISRPNVYGEWDVTYVTDTGSGAVCYYNHPNTYEAWGGQPVYWRASLSFPYYSQYACQWSQWADYDLPASQLPEHGWYHALPWLTQRNGAPRGMYLELDTIDYDAKLEEHSPVLVYDTNETFAAINPGAATDFYDDSDDPDDPEDSNRLADANGAFATANHALAVQDGLDPLTLDFLAASYDGVRSGSASDGDFISERGDGTPAQYAADAAYMGTQPGYVNRVYGRVAHGADGALWLQYWIFYYADPQENFFGSGIHEGDWEVVQIRLNGSLQPDRAAYAQHSGGEVCDWGDVDVVNGRPFVYVAQDSHAAYFAPGTYEDPDPDESADGGSVPEQPALVQVKAETTAWLTWPGRWGDSGSSPAGPLFQSAKSSDPSGWAEGLASCGTVN